MGTFTDQQIKAAAKEMNLVLGLDPAIKLKDVAEMEKGIQVATALIEEGDSFTKATLAVIDGLKPKSKGKEAAPKGKAKPPVEDEEEEDDEPVAPKGKGKTAPAPKGKKPPVEEEEDEEEEDEPVAPKGKGKGKPEPVAPPKGKGKAKPPVEEEEEEDEDEPDDEEEEDDEPVSPKGKGKGKPAPAPAPKGKVKEDAKEKGEKKSFVAAAYNRVDALCEALNSSPKTTDEWSQKADKLLVKNGGTANHKENLFTMGYFYKIAKNIDLGVKLPKKG